MLDLDDPKQVKKYKASGIMFIVSMVLVLLILGCCVIYIYLNKVF